MSEQNYAESILEAGRELARTVSVVSTPCGPRLVVPDGMSTVDLSAQLPAPLTLQQTVTVETEQSFVDYVTLFAKKDAPPVVFAALRGATAQLVAVLDYHASPAEPSWNRHKAVLPNVWLGTSVEDQATADARIPTLLQTPAAIRFISAEPLLAAVTLRRSWLMGGTVEHGKPFVETGGVIEWQHPLDWVIVGGESGGGSRPCDSWWIESIVDDCRNAGTPVFVKQLGSHILSPNDVGFEGDTERGWPMDTTYETTTPQNWQGDDVRVRLKSRKGGDPSEWPEALRVRQFPEVRA